MKITVSIDYPEDMTYLTKRAGELLAEILVKKLQPKQIDEFIDILKDEGNKITW